MIERKSKKFALLFIKYKDSRIGRKDGRTKVYVYDKRDQSGN